MHIPRRLPKAPKRSSRWRSQGHLSFVRKHECSVPGCNGRPIEAAHVRLGSGAGLSQKPHDWRAVPLCKAHHVEQHTKGEATFWEKAGVDVEKLIDWFCANSPKRVEIREARNGER